MKCARSCRRSSPRCSYCSAAAQPHPSIRRSPTRIRPPDTVSRPGSSMRATRRTSSSSRSRAAERAPPRSRTGFSKRCETPRSSGRRPTRAAARLGRRHHRRLRRQLHRAGVRPLWRPALQRIRAALSQAQRPGRAARPGLESRLLGAAGLAVLGPLRARRRSLRRDPVQRRNVRRPAARRGAHDRRVGDRLELRCHGSTSRRRCSTSCVRTWAPSGCRARRHRRRACRSCCRR